MGRSLRQTITSRTHSDLPLVVWGRRAPGVARQRREGSSAWKAATSSGYTGFSGLAARSGMCRPWSAKGSGGRGRGTRSAGQLVHCRCRLVPPLLVAGQRASASGRRPARPASIASDRSCASRNASLMPSAAMHEHTAWPPASRSVSGTAMQLTTRRAPDNRAPTRRYDWEFQVSVTASTAF